jgi:hypothetical protein
MELHLHGLVSRSVWTLSRAPNCIESHCHVPGLLLRAYTPSRDTWYPFERRDPCTLLSVHEPVGIIDWPDQADLLGATHCPLCFECLGGTRAPEG